MRTELKCDADPEDLLSLLPMENSVVIGIKYGASEEALAVRFDDRAKVETLRDTLNEWLGRNA